MKRYDRFVEFRAVRATAVLMFVCIAADAGAVGARRMNVVAGIVTDLAGHPIAGAKVVGEAPGLSPSSATTNADGRFMVGWHAAPADVTLTVEHPGYQRYALSGFATNGPLATIALTRVIDAAYLAGIAAETDPARFRARAADLLTPSSGTTGQAFPIDAIVPALANLRAPLRAWLPADVAALARKDLPRDQDVALRLLALLGDPRDDAFVEAWIAGEPKRAARPPRPCRGPTMVAALNDWEAAHFAKEGYRDGEPRPYTSRTRAESPGGGHAVVTVHVRYAHWGYSQRIVLVRSGDSWDVRWVLPDKTFHTR